MGLSPELLHEMSRVSQELRQFIIDLMHKNDELTEENNNLKARLNQTPANSSTPPSKSQYIKPKSLREKTERKPGGQPGHNGSTLRLSETPDEVIEHIPGKCCNCEYDLSEQPSINETKRQVIDVIVTRRVTEHLHHVKVCPRCKKTNVVGMSQGPEHYIQYGDTFSAILIYLSQGNYIPYERLSQISQDIFGIKISSGTLVNIVQKCGESLDESMNYIKDQITEAPVVHFDETGNRINGKNKWLHSASNSLFTYLQTHDKRGNAATKDIGILPEFKGTAVHDFWKPYFKYNNCLHALCNAHIIRELTGIVENFHQSWPDHMKTLLLNIKHAVGSAVNGKLSPSEINEFDDRYDKLLILGDSENPIKIPDKNEAVKRGRKPQSKARNLLDRMKLYKSDILRFMTDPATPFENNLAERDLRMSKLHQKISGCFRSEGGNKAFDNIRSYISTASKHGVPVFESIKTAVSGNPMFSKENTQLY